MTRLKHLNCPKYFDRQVIVNIADQEEQSDQTLHCLILMFMPPTLKKLMGHIAFGACVGACVTLFVPTVTFKLIKLES